MLNRIKNISIIVLIIISSFLLYKFLKKEESEIIKVPVVIEVPIPGIENTFPPLIMPKPKIERSKPKLQKKFVKADSITKDSLYADAVIERLYDTIYSDTIQDVRVKSLVQGKLLKQEVSYNIFPRMIQIDTFVDYDLSNNKKVQVFGLMELGSNIDNISPLVKGSIILKNKKDNLLSISFDSQKNAYIGYGFKF